MRQKIEKAQALLKGVNNLTEPQKKAAEVMNTFLAAYENTTNTPAQKFPVLEKFERLLNLPVMSRAEFQPVLEAVGREKKAIIGHQISPIDLRKKDKVIKEEDATFKRIQEEIALYNSSQDPKEKAKSLHTIDQFLKIIDHKYLDEEKVVSPNYIALCDQLFYDLQEGKIHLEGKPKIPVNPDSIIANMSPGKANELFTILKEERGLASKADLDSLKELYKLQDGSDDPSEEAENFRTFLKDNEIVQIGTGNSKNFKITHRDTNESFVLKVENRLGMPRNIEDHLRAEFKDLNCFTHKYGEQIRIR